MSKVKASAKRGGKAVKVERKIERRFKEVQRRVQDEGAAVDAVRPRVGSAVGAYTRPFGG